MSGISANDASYKDSTGKYVPVTSDITSKWDNATSYSLQYTFKIGNTVKVNDGDTATVTLPEGVQFPPNTNETVTLNNIGSITINTTKSTNTATIHFNKYFADNTSSRTGTLTLTVRGVKNSNNINKNTFIIKSGGPFSEEDPADPTAHKVTDSWPVKHDGVYGFDKNGRYQYIDWNAIINPNNDTIDKAVINDTIKDPNEHIVPGTLFIKKAGSDQILTPGDGYTVTYHPNDTAPTGFTLNWAGTLNDQLQVYYLGQISDQSAYSKTGDISNFQNYIEIKGNVGNNQIPVDNNAYSTGNVTLGVKGGGTGTNVISVKKVWKYVPNGVTKPSITATLYANGTSTKKTVTLDSKNNYADQFTDLAKNDADGNPIKYTVVEGTPDELTPNKDQPVVPADYDADPGSQETTAGGTATLTNRYDPKTNITVNKEWHNVPASDKGKTPSITAVLYKNGKATSQTVELTSKNSYSDSFKDLPTIDADGKTITYTVAESQVPSGYQSTTTGPQPVKDGKVTLINDYSPKKTTSITVNKIWKGVPSGVTPPDIKATLYGYVNNKVISSQTVTFNKTKGYSHTFNKLPTADSNGNAITYKVAEQAAADNSPYTEVTPGQLTPDKDGKVTLINQYNSKKTTSITVNKQWKDVPSGVIPPSITAILYANGKATSQTVE
ncbi:Cna B-type domain-containing protein, partial [Lentilactobacillus parafarraginis]|uniref:Cna B-type domain-containing protein n=1 Tax=Lentilactobacillus parafarraginis TaxID=390842 RepID=UPI001C654B0C